MSRGHELATGAAEAPSEAASPNQEPPGRAVPVLALMMFLAPALGVPHEYLLQDTLKSVVVACGALLAGLLLCWPYRQRHWPEGFYWHGLLCLPLALMAYALCSMAWSHTYLAGVEAVRWFVFSLLLWVGLNTFSPQRLPQLALGIHAGAVLASLWAALQFWVDLDWFPQGPSPASTFVNRNFFAEYVVCTLPLSALLIARARGPGAMALLAISTGLSIVAVLMTGTRSALVALAVMLLVLPMVLYRWRSQLAFAQWGGGQRGLLVAALLGTVLGLGAIPTGNPALIRETTQAQLGQTALSRAMWRGHSVAQAQEYTHGSFSLRMVMWKATARMIAAHPVAGIGAGAWEVHIPRYQASGAQLETDFYAHNEILQLLAEYGLLGWLFTGGLTAYLARVAWQTWRHRSAPAQVHAPWRATALICLLMFLIVGSAGFPWRMASTGALFALLLAVLAATDARQGVQGLAGAHPLRWKPPYPAVATAGLLACAALAVFISYQAARAERKIVRAVKLALTVSQSHRPGDPRWAESRREVLTLVREGVAINPHYRKLTPMVADELARWGDWRSAIEIWESVAASRPYVVAILTNIARGHARLGNTRQAQAYLDRASALQPRAPAVASLAVILLANSGREAQALEKARELLAQNIHDPDLLNATYILGSRAKDWPLAIRALEVRNRDWPAMAVDGWLKIARIQSQPEVNDPARALQAYRAALAAAPEDRREAVHQAIPQPYRSQL